MNRTGWIAFTMVQTLGLICSWIWAYDILGTGTGLYATGLFALFPGDFVSGFIVEKVLWHTGLTLRQMGLLEIPIIVALNMGAWFLCGEIIRAIKQIFHRRRGRSKTDEKAGV